VLEARDESRDREGEAFEVVFVGHRSPLGYSPAYLLLIFADAYLELSPVAAPNGLFYIAKIWRAREESNP